jgi:hypothetical protein
VPENSANDFVNRIQQIVTPPSKDFFKIESCELNERRKTIIDTELFDDVSKVLNQIKAVSNFDSEISSFWFDLIAGTSCLLVNPGHHQSILTYQTIPFREYCFSEDVEGQINAVYRHLRRQENKNESLELLEATEYNPVNKIWEYQLINLKTQDLLASKNYKTNPFIILRWQRPSGEYYGRGIGFDVINDVKTLNKIMNWSLRILEFQLPIFLITRDQKMNDRFLLEPGAQNFVNSNDANNPSIRQLQVQSNFDISQYRVQDLINSIKRTMLSSTLPNEPKVRTASEIHERTKEFELNLTSIYGRILNDFIYPLVRRSIEVIQEFGYLQSFDLEWLNGLDAKIAINSDIMNYINREEIENIVEANLYLRQMGEDPNKYIKLNESNIALLHKMNVGHLRNLVEIEEYEKNIGGKNNG